MPNLPLAVQNTNSSPFTFQFSEKRIDGIPLHIPASAGVTSCTNRRIVTIQQSTTGVRYAVLSPVAATGFASEALTIIGWGVLEGALQSGGINSIAPSPLTFVDGDTVSVLRGLVDTYMIDYDPSNKPTLGIATGYVDQQGRLTSVTTGGNVHLGGPVFDTVPSLQMANQLLPNTLFYQLKDAVTP
jgi:hypothetical protein